MSKVGIIVYRYPPGTKAITMKPNRASFDDANNRH